MLRVTVNGEPLLLCMTETVPQLIHDSKVIPTRTIQSPGLEAGDANEPSTSKSTRATNNNSKATLTEDHLDLLPGTRHETVKEPKLP